MAQRNTGERFPALDMLRGGAVLWMTLFHFAFDLNHFGFIQQDFYRAPLWTVQRTCILSLFLFCAGFGQAMAVHAGQSWGHFWRRWMQIAGCAVAVSLGSALMFPHSWIYFGVLHGMAVMLILCRLTAGWGNWLWPCGLAALAAGWWAPQVQALLPLPAAWDAKTLNWIGLISHKPITEDYVPLLPWLGVMWWGMAAGRLAQSRGWLARLAVQDDQPAATALTWVGRWSLCWYMVHQPVLIGILTAVTALR
ncbi:MAG: DUF1624 domain-containing protein [Burkholderiales bacterium]|nr:DUF1624 domain-containing protein [Burkholderiales bacterium]